MTRWELFSDAFLNLAVAREALPIMLSATWLTIHLSLLVIVTGMICGFVLALLRTIQWAPITILISFFADLFRTIPPLVLICLFYFGLPSAGITLSGYACAWLALSLILTAYAEESFWAGISATPRGQREAARSTGLTNWQALSYVILPQAVRLAVAPLTNRTISIAKGTSYASVVAVPEILGAAQGQLTFTYNATPLLMAAALYIMIFVPVVMAGRAIERAFQAERR